MHVAIQSHFFPIWLQFLTPMYSIVIPFFAFRHLCAHFCHISNFHLHLGYEDIFVCFLNLLRNTDKEDF